MSTNDAVEAGLDIALAVSNGDEPVLTHGWFIGTDSQCNYCNDWQVENMVGLGHSDLDVLRTTRGDVSALGLSRNLMPNLNVSQFIFIRRPQS